MSYSFNDDYRKKYLTSDSSLINARSRSRYPSSTRSSYSLPPVNRIPSDIRYLSGYTGSVVSNYLPRSGSSTRRDSSYSSRDLYLTPSSYSPSSRSSSVTRSEDRKVLGGNINNVNENKYPCLTTANSERSPISEESFSSKLNIRDGEWSDTKCGLRGLRNIGNTCYMNSVIQCLAHTKLLKEYVLSKRYVVDLNGDGALIKVFGELLAQMWKGSTEAADSTSFKRVFQRIAPRFSGYEQHDAQEFLRFLLDKLHGDVNKVTKRPVIDSDIDDTLTDRQLAGEYWQRYLKFEDSHIVDLFVGQLKSTLKCQKCGNKSVTYEPFWDLSLPIPGESNNRVSLVDILRNFTQEEYLDGMEKPKCNSCKVERRMSKKYLVQKLPRYLVLHLKRFHTGGMYRKLSTVVDFPVEGLDVGEFVALSATATRRSYNLYAVCNHHGSPFSGHYTATCRHPFYEKWFLYNDGIVSPASAPTPASDAYILFYVLTN